MLGSGLRVEGSKREKSAPLPEPSHQLHVENRYQIVQISSEATLESSPSPAEKDQWLHAAGRVFTTAPNEDEQELKTSYREIVYRHNQGCH